MIRAWLRRRRPWTSSLAERWEAQFTWRRR
jgi:hypothetical protein